MSEAEYNLHGVELAVLQRRRDHEGARTFRTKDCDPWPLPSYCESCRAHMLFFSAPKSALPLRDLIQSSGGCINGSTVISRAAIAALPYLVLSTSTTSQIFQWSSPPSIGIERHSTRVLLRRAAPIQQLETSTAAPQRWMLLDVSGGIFSAISDERLTTSFS